MNIKLLEFKPDSALLPIGILARICLPLHFPALEQELPASGYYSSKNQSTRREPLPINPRYLFTGLARFYSDFILRSTRE